MLKYIDRRNTDCAKWDALEKSFSRSDLLAMWVADMDFQVPECVSEALKKYVDMGAFGYYAPPAGYYDAFIEWERRYHGCEVKREWIRFAPGVVPAFNWMVQVLTGEGEAVAVMPPVYYPFMHAVNNNSRRLVEVPLMLTGNGYVMDYEGFESAIIREDVKAFIFCSPHNPVGRVWKKDEIRRMLDICKKHRVYVISDEIHHDIIMSGYEHVPAATVGRDSGSDIDPAINPAAVNRGTGEGESSSDSSAKSGSTDSAAGKGTAASASATSYDEIMVTLTAATKTFNLASVQNSFVIIPDKNIRKMWDTFVTGIRITGGNAFGYIAVQAAYEKGRPWFEELLDVIEGNYRYLRSRLEYELPEVRVADLEGTYLMWIDLSAYMEADPNECDLKTEGANTDASKSETRKSETLKPEMLKPEMRKPEIHKFKAMKQLMEDECGIAVDYGEWFGGEEYAGCIRVNLATSRENIEYAADRIVRSLKK